jgi:hypothetical protein
MNPGHLRKRVFGTIPALLVVGALAAPRTATQGTSWGIHFEGGVQALDADQHACVVPTPAGNVCDNTEEARQRRRAAALEEMSASGDERGGLRWARSTAITSQ